jgi:hypothetical protein
VAQLDDKNPITVRIQHEGQTRTLNCNAEQDCATVQTSGFLAVDSIRRAVRVTSSIFNCRYSVFFWQLLLLEQMTNEVPGITLGIENL